LTRRAAGKCTAALVKRVPLNTLAHPVRVSVVLAILFLLILRPEALLIDA
jgi:hypothetical protein